MNTSISFLKKSLFVATLLVTVQFVSAATYDISSIAECSVSQYNGEIDSTTCIWLYQTATLNASQAVNTNLVVSISRSAFIVQNAGVTFNCSGGCSGSFRANTTMKLLSSGSVAGGLSSGQQSGSGTLNTGNTIGATSVTFSGNSSVPYTCPPGTAGCTVFPIEDVSVPFSVTSAATPCVRIGFGGVSPCS